MNNTRFSLDLLKIHKLNLIVIRLIKVVWVYKIHKMSDSISAMDRRVDATANMLQYSLSL